MVLRTRIKPDGGNAYDLRLPGQKGWKPFLSFSFEESQAGSTPLGFDRNATWLYGLLIKDGLPRLVRWRTEDLHSCTDDCPNELVYQSKSGALGVELSDPETDAPQILIETDLRSRKIIIDQELLNDLSALKQLAKDREFYIVDDDLDSMIWLVSLYSDTHSPQYWIWNRNQKKGRKLFSINPLLDKYKLSAMESLELRARDGLRLPSYLTRSTLNQSGPQPFVLLVHGGPQARDYWGLNSIHQLLANRGYHVLSVNYRGSTGFGQSHLLAGEGQWYAAMQDDLVDAVQWAVDEGIADPKKIVIMGGSYGGYAALAGLTRDPEVFAAAVDIVGPSNVETLLESIPPYWEPIRKPWERMVGVGRVDLEAISPLTYANRIQSPLLIVHGANDVRVKLSESESIVAAMHANDLPVDFIVFPDEGHGIEDPRNSLALYAVIEEFLAKQLGGRFEPIGGAIKDSSMQWQSKSATGSIGNK
ncbi:MULTISPECIES: alpha/beta hydrolase family protein [unclassified Prochlorococcus]|uniref:alpha/beta hydrolase family protein n=1 Tax=unclassified Prochlorococcus TaxID=2627481 RepID=UPI001F4CA498|nr:MULTISPECIES: S9 family peptidase [unclassified Prochlorococcus]